MAKKPSQSPGYLTLCYHYVRSKQASQEIPLILGNSESDFRKHIQALSKKYQIISPQEALDFSYYKKNIKLKKRGLLFTFDDGLSDHLLAAKILAENEIKAIFFVPTCILQEQPANPIIIHYALATAKIVGFLDSYFQALKDFKIPKKQFNLQFNSQSDCPWQTIASIKNMFKYRFDHRTSRKILLYIYNHLLLKNDPNIFSKMHLTHNQIKEIVALGHNIGTHTNTHISVGSCKLAKKEFNKEVIRPQKLVSLMFETDTYAFSYPFGDKQDCLDAKQLIEKNNVYKLAFTVENIVNFPSTSPLELGRYMPHSQDTTPKLLKKLAAIEQKSAL